MTAPIIPAAVHRKAIPTFLHLFTLRQTRRTVPITFSIDLVQASERRSCAESPRRLLFALYRLGYHSRMTAHGFRAIASTTLNEPGYRPDVIERQLAHAEKNAVRAAYHRSQYPDERRTMMQQWADHLDAHRASDGKVVAIGQAGRKRATRLEAS